VSASLVLPVPLLSARAWAHGWIGDLELFTAPRVPEALYVVTLPDLAAWRAVLPELADWHRAGASALVLRSQTPAVCRHVTKWGAVPTYRDASGGFRYVAGPSVVSRYFGRIAQNSAATSGVMSNPSTVRNSR
jgi:hypothetical protein